MLLEKFTQTLNAYFMLKLQLFDIWSEVKHRILEEK